MAGDDRTMPMLEELSRETKNCLGPETDNIVVLHINHCMENSFYFSRVLKGIFHDVIFIGAPYNDRRVEEEYPFRYLYGRNLRGSYELYDGSRCFARADHDFMAVMEALIRRALIRYLAPYMEEGRRLLIFEDGGYHYPVLGRLKLPPGKVIGCVEQTASGTLRCREYGAAEGFSYPCASISRSEIKVGMESRFIGHRVTEELGNFLYSANTFWDFHNVLIIGYGIVGRRVAMDLRGKKCRVAVYDTDARIRDTARAEGYQVVSKLTPEYFKHTAIVVGNTGKPSFTGEMLTAFLEGGSPCLYLASSSSQDWEFKEFLNMVSNSTPFPPGAVLAGWEDEEFYTVYHVMYQGAKKDIYLMAQGLPVNFYRKDAVSLTDSILDLVFSEMLSMGTALCKEKQLPKALYLLGEHDGFLPFWSEAELLKLWFARYDLSWGENLRDILDIHPDSGYLRKKLLQEKGTWKNGL